MDEKDFRRVYDGLCERALNAFLNDGHVNETVIGVDGRGRAHFVPMRGNMDRAATVQAIRQLFRILAPSMYVHVTGTRVVVHEPGRTSEVDAIVVLGVSRQWKLLRTYEILWRAPDIKPDAIFRGELAPVPGDGDDPMMTLMDDLD